MELKKRHRLSLLNALNSAIEKIDLAKAIILKENEKIGEGFANDKLFTESCEIIASFEIQQFLGEREKKLIEQSFINNEIDF